MHRALTTLCLVLAACCGVALLEHLDFGAKRLVECLIVFLCAAFAVWAARGWVRSTALIVCSITLGVVILQILAPLLLPSKAGNQAVVRNENLVSSRPIVGWGPRHPGVFHIVKTAGGGHVIFDAHATIDETYRRKTIPSDGPNPIAFFGDSFIFGDGLNDSETLPQAFADINRGKIPVLNLGFSGWAPSQNLAALERGIYKSALIAPRRLILFTSLFHVERTSCRGAFAWGSGPRYVLDGSTVKYAGTCVGSTPRFVTTVMQFVRGFVSGGATRSNGPTRRDVETYIKIIEAFSALARDQYKVGTTVLMEPGGDEYVAGTGFNFTKIVDTLRTAGVDVLVKTDPPLADRHLYQIEGDGHPTGLANRMIAQQLELHLRSVDPSALDVDHAAGN